MSVAIRHIVFDIGKVLIHYDPNLPYSKIIPDEAERRWFFANVCTSAWNLEQDRGRSWADAEAELVARFPGQEANIRAFRKNWRAMVPYAYEDSVEVLTSLIKAGHDVTMLTNFAADTFTEAREIFPFLNQPRGVTVSGEIGLIKPGIEIYQRHTEDFGLGPSATLFIDDVMENVEGAKAAGWQAVQFTGAEQLKRDLASLGVTH